jgi:hypothetical protein
VRKLFRMKYESCNGQCYADEDVMRIHVLGLDVEGAAAFLRRLLAMHEPSCGNPQISFSLDVEDGQADQPPTYVAAMQRYGALDLHVGRTALEAMDKLIDGALAWYSSVEYQVLVSEQPGAGHEVCHHGDDRALIEFAITRSGLSAPDQQALRARLA